MVLCLVLCVVLWRRACVCVSCVLTHTSHHNTLQHDTIQQGSLTKEEEDMLGRVEGGEQLLASEKAAWVKLLQVNENWNGQSLPLPSFLPSFLCYSIHHPTIPPPPPPPPYTLTQRAQYSRDVVDGKVNPNADTPILTKRELKRVVAANKAVKELGFKAE
jgi:hypothetical protein